MASNSTTQPVCGPNAFDVIVEVTSPGSTSVYRFNVSFQALAKASPVLLKKIIESVGTLRYEGRINAELEFDECDKWVISLSEDPEAMAVLLDVVHGNERVPHELSLDLLYRVLTLAKKLDMIACLEGYVERWAAPWVIQVNTGDVTALELQKAIVAGLAADYTPLLITAAKKLVLEGLVLSKDKQFIFRDEKIPLMEEEYTGDFFGGLF